MVATFVDSAPLFDLLSTTNNQVIYGRRGTGKTHALKFLSERVLKSGDLPIYLDLRSVGSNGSIYGDATRTLAERASVLVVDVLTGIYDELFQIALVKIDGALIGIELGADVAADLNLDDFLVFENNQTKATNFFRNLIYKHYTTTEDALIEIDSAEKFVQMAFTQAPVFEEFVRAVEGVPRDALNLAAKIATKAFGQKISMQHVRAAARDWYQQDKASVIRANEDLSKLLDHVIDEVIGTRKARAFLFTSNMRDPRIDQLFDSRLLHILKKNISSHDEPGARYDVYKIDYGCYVDLINTAKMPEGLFEAQEGDGEEGQFVEVPKDDYRSIRRAILRLEDLAQTGR